MPIFHNTPRPGRIVKRRLFVKMLMWLPPIALVGCQIDLENLATAQPTLAQLFSTTLSAPTTSPPQLKSPSPPGQQISSITIDELRVRWLSGQPCQPPCWENIIPGETSLDQATDILKSTPFVANVSVVLLPDPPSGIIWDMAVDSPNYWGGEASFGSDNIIFAIGTRYPDTKLDELIRAFGQPSHVMAYEIPAIDQFSGNSANSAWHIHILWIPFGMVLETSGESPPPRISGELVLSSAEFFSPSLEAYGNATYFMNEARAKPWQGFGEFHEYSGSTFATPTPKP